MKSGRVDLCFACLPALMADCLLGSFCQSLCALTLWRRGITEKPPPLVRAAGAVHMRCTPPCMPPIRGCVHARAETGDLTQEPPAGLMPHVSTSHCDLSADPPVGIRRETRSTRWGRMREDGAAAGGGPLIPASTAWAELASEGLQGKQRPPCEGDPRAHMEAPSHAGGALRLRSVPSRHLWVCGCCSGLPQSSFLLISPKADDLISPGKGRRSPPLARSQFEPVRRRGGPSPSSGSLDLVCERWSVWLLGDGC